MSDKWHKPGGKPLIPPRPNPTERPEERDSLSEFTEHLSSPDDDDNAGYHHYVIRTLINEVKELREEDERATQEVEKHIALYVETNDRREQMEEALRGLQWSASDYRAMDPQHRPSADAIITSIETVTGKALG